MLTLSQPAAGMVVDAIVRRERRRLGGKDPEPEVCSDLFGLAWRGSEVKSTPMLWSKSIAPYLNRNNSYLYRLAHHFGPNWRECSRWSK